MNKDLNFNLSDDEIILLNKYYSKIRYSTEFRFLRRYLVVFQIKIKKYSLISRKDYKYIDIRNVKKLYNEFKIII